MCIVCLYVHMHMCREEHAGKIKFGKVFKMFLNFSNIPYQLGN